MDAFIQRIDALSTMGCTLVATPPTIGLPAVSCKIACIYSMPCTCRNVAFDSCNVQCRYTVLLSNFRRYFKLASYISTHTNQSIVIAMGVPSLRVSAVFRRVQDCQHVYKWCKRCSPAMLSDTDWNWRRSYSLSGIMQTWTVESWRASGACSSLI
jgi:hypothetical protein